VVFPDVGAAQGSYNYPAGSQAANVRVWVPGVLSGGGALVVRGLLPKENDKMTEQTGSYQILTGLELANQVLRMMDRQRAFYASPINSLERKRLVVECKQLEAGVYNLAEKLLDRPGDTGVFAFEVKLLVKNQREYFMRSKSRGYVTRSEKQKDLEKVRRLEAGTRESAERIVAAARKFSMALEAQGLGGKIVEVVSAPEKPKERGEAWEQFGF